VDGQPPHVAYVRRAVWSAEGDAPRKRVIREAAETCLGEREQLIVCLPEARSKAFRLMHRGEVAWLSSIPIAVTDRRVLFFAIAAGSAKPFRRLELILIDDPPLAEVKFIRNEKRRLVGLVVRGQEIRFSFGFWDVGKAVDVLGYQEPGPTS
jgi:hypothetical protein